MSDDPANPYESPSAASEVPAAQPRALWRSRFPHLLVFNTLALVGILATQGLCERRFERLEVELPFSTTVALGPLLPSILGCFLITTIAVGPSLKTKRSRNLWEAIAIMLLGMVVGYYVIGMLLPYAWRPVQLT